jgi:hypothetical protein
VLSRGGSAAKLARHHLASAMSVPSTKRLHGIWPPLLLETRPDGRIDLDAITEGTRYFASAGVHGVYTADTASEF